MMDRTRVAVLAAILFLPLGGLQARLVSLQILHRDDYVGSAFATSASLNLSLAPRGPIVDRHGRLLAHDDRSFDLYLILEEFEKSPGARAAVEALLDESLADGIEAAYRKIERAMNLRPERERPQIFRRERRTPYPVRKGMSFDQARAIETALDRYPGCLVRESLRRVYPHGPTAAHVVGYLGRVSDSPPAPGKESEYDRLFAAGYFTEGFQDLIGEDGEAQLARRDLFREQLIGRAGAERSYDDLLRGRAGLLILERNPLTGAKDWIELLPSRAGDTLELTLDIRLQADVEAILADAKDECSPVPCPVRAHAIVMDPWTGELLVLASNVGFDPNHFTPPSSRAVIDAYLQDRQQPLLAHPFANQFHAGSVFKIATALAALEEGKAAPASTVACNGRYSDRYSTFSCWTVGYGVAPHGDLDVAGALQHSCNCFFFSVSESLGLAGQWKWADRLGFGRVTGLDLPGEADGALPGPDARRWLVTDSYNLAIGQGELMVTPLQVARSMAAVANGSVLVRPRVARSLQPGGEPLRISAPALAAIRKGLRDCTHERGGTAFDSGLREFGAAGKTGSAQKRDRNHPNAWFAGYAPFDKPRYVVVVLAESAKGGGGHVAAPLAHKILKRVFAAEAN